MELQSYKKAQRELLALIVALLILAGLLLFGLATHGQQKPAPAKVVSIKADADFLDTLADYKICTWYLADLEQKTGVANFPIAVGDLRRHCAAKEQKLNAWMAAHGVGNGWTFDGQANTFLPPKEPKKP